MKKKPIISTGTAVAIVLGSAAASFIVPSKLHPYSSDIGTIMFPPLTLAAGLLGAGIGSTFGRAREGAAVGAAAFAVVAVVKP